MLLPLEDAAIPADLRHTLQVWLDHNCAWDPASKALRMHRHTLRHRVDVASDVLGLDLQGFAGRAELWGALQLTQETASSRRKSRR